MWLCGPPNLEKMEAKRDVKGLIKALFYRRDADVRRAAADALDKMDFRPDEGKVGAAYWVVRRGWDKCAEIGVPAIEPLIGALRASSIDERFAAAGALGKIGTTAVAPLIAALRDRNHDVRLAAARALGLIGDARAVAPLIAALRGGNDHVRSAAAHALGLIGDARAVGPLVAVLKDGRLYTRVAAAHALAKLGDPRAVEPLVVALKAEDNDVREEAAHTLGQTGDVRAVEPLIATLKDERREVLNFERECALDLEDQGCRRSSRLTLGTPSARRPDDLDRLCHSGQPFADDLLPIEQKTGLTKTLPLRHPIDGRGQEFGERLGPSRACSARALHL